jgi:hypothetical protein
MVRRATGSAERLAGRKAVRDDAEDTGPRAIALDLTSLLAPYRKQGRVLLRIERVPQLWRLSSGRNNGNGSWSLTLDELDGLEYFQPDGHAEAHTLAIRIVDPEGDTIAVLDYLVSPVGIAGNAVGGAGAAQIEAYEAQLKRLRDELTKTKTALVSRNDEIASLRQSLDAVTTDDSSLDDIAERIETALALARTEWAAETEKRLRDAATRAALGLERARAQWESEHASEALSGESQEEALKRTREEAQRDKAKALADAERKWKSEEAGRLAAAEARWREESGSLDSRTGADAAEISRLREEQQRLEAALAARETELNAARKAAEDIRARAKRETEAALKRAEAAARTDVDAAEVAALREEQARLEAALAAREADLTAARKAAEDWRTRARRETEAALKKAEEDAAEKFAAQSAEAEAEWQKERRSAERALLAMTTRATKAEAQLVAAREDAKGALAAIRREDQEAALRAEGERAAMKIQLETLKAKVAERDAALSQLHQATEKARLDWQRESEAALEKAKAEWRAAEVLRSAAAETTVRETAARILAEATTRYEVAEAALAEARSKAESNLAEARKADAEEMRSLREERIQLTALLSERDRSFTELKASSDQALIAAQQEAREALTRARAEWKAAEQSRLAAAEAQRKKQSADALAEATTRYQVAEATLAQIRKESAVSRDQEHGNVQRLQEKIALLQSALNDKERSRSVDGDRAGSTDKIILRTNDEWAADDMKVHRGTSFGRVVRDVALAGALAASIAVLFPLVVPYLPPGLQAQLANATNALGTMLGTATQRDTIMSVGMLGAVVTETVNLRAGPSTDTEILTRLEAGAAVAVLEERGEWREVEWETAGGAQRGWVYSSFLAPAENDAVLAVQGE